MTFFGNRNLKLDLLAALLGQTPNLPLDLREGIAPLYGCRNSRLRTKSAQATQSCVKITTKNCVLCICKGIKHIIMGNRGLARTVL